MINPGPIHVGHGSLRTRARLLRVLRLAVVVDAVGVHEAGRERASGTLDQGLVNDPLEGPVYLMGTGLLGSCVLTLSFCVGYLGPAFRTSLVSGTLLVTLK